MSEKTGGHGNDRTRFSAGAVISHYKITERIGHGGMGDIYKAVDLDLDRTVALKFLSGFSSEDRRNCEALKDEAKAASHLNHPNIVSIYAIEEFDGSPFIAMEYVEGKTLRDLIDEGDLTMAEITDYAFQIARAIEAAEKHGIVHQDINSRNIMVADGVVKVLDFGIASAPSKKSAAEGGDVGTMAYMSPEQALGNPVDNRSDIFSYGVVLYELVAGHLPFGGDYEAALKYSIINEIPRPVSDFCSGVPDLLESVISKCLEKKPAERYQGADTILFDLRRLSDERSRTARQRSRKFPVVFPAIGLVAVLAIVFVIIRQSVPPPPPSAVRLAVIALDSDSENGKNYFSNEITDEIKTKLASIEDLTVISTGNPELLKERYTDVRKFARELGVEFFLEVKIYFDQPQPAGRVRINTSLLRVEDFAYIYAESYERDLVKIFQIQSDIATKVANALKVHISKLVRESMVEIPTQDIDAYLYYLKGKEAFRKSWTDKDIRTAIGMFERAVELDAEFALAFASLSRGHSALYSEFYDHSDERMRLARSAADNALRLQPDLPDAHYALGMYYYGYMFLDSALTELFTALKSQPSNSDLYSAVAGVQRRQGNLPEAIANYERAAALDPTSSLKIFDIGYTYGLRRQYHRAREYMDRAILIAPEWPLPYIYKAWLYLFFEGSKQKAADVLDNAPKTVNLGQSEYPEYYWWLSRILDDDYSLTLKKITLASDTSAYYLHKARIYRLVNSRDVEEAYSDSARIFLEPRAKSSPGEAMFHSRLGLAYAGLGRYREAVSEGALAVKMSAGSKEALSMQFWVANLAEIYMIAGQLDSSAETLALLLSLPGFASPQYLRIDPLWKPLEGNPIFENLLAKENIGSAG